MCVSIYIANICIYAIWEIAGHSWIRGSCMRVEQETVIGGGGDATAGCRFEFQALGRLCGVDAACWKDTDAKGVLGLEGRDGGGGGGGQMMTCIFKFGYGREREREREQRERESTYTRHRLQTFK